MMNGIGSNHIGNNPIVCRMRSNVTKDESGLSYRESQILSLIRDIVGGPVELNLGQRSDCGLTIAALGFAGASGCGSRPSFLITPNILREMAECEDKFHEHMSWIQRAVQQQTELENFLRNNKNKVQNNQDQQEVERRSLQIRLNMMSVLDFWNENRDENRSWIQPIQGQSMQQMASRYEQMLSVQ